MSFRQMLWIAPVLLFTGFFSVAPNATAATDDTRLSDYIQRMKRTYPDLQSMRAMIDAEQSRTDMKSGWMNPTLSVGAMNVPYPSLRFDMEPMTMLQFGLMQRIPFPGRTSLQRHVGDAKVNSLQADLKLDEREMSRMVRMAYYDLAAAEATQSILDSGTTLLQEMRGAAEAMTGSTMGSSADIYSVDAEIADWSRKISENQSLLKSRKAVLASLVGQQSSDTLLVDALPSLLPNTNNFQFDQQAIDRSPKVVDLQKKVAGSNAELELAKKSYFPDFDVMLQYGYRFRLQPTATVDMTGVVTTPNGTTYQDPMVSLGVSFPLPIWAKGNQKAEIGEMNSMLNATKQKLELARVEQRRDLETEQAEYDRVAQSVIALRNEIIPARTKAWQASLIGYRSGGTTLMAVSEARMKLLMAKMEERMLMAEAYARAGNLLERIEP